MLSSYKTQGCLWKRLFAFWFGVYLNPVQGRLGAAGRLFFLPLRSSALCTAVQRWRSPDSRPAVQRDERRRRTLRLRVLQIELASQNVKDTDWAGGAALALSPRRPSRGCRWVAVGGGVRQWDPPQSCPPPTRCRSSGGNEGRRGTGAAAVASWCLRQGRRRRSGSRALAASPQRPVVAELKAPGSAEPGREDGRLWPRGGAERVEARVSVAELQSGRSAVPDGAVCFGLTLCKAWKTSVVGWCCRRESAKCARVVWEMKTNGARSVKAVAGWPRAAPWAGSGEAVPGLGASRGPGAHHTCVFRRHGAARGSSLPRRPVGGRGACKPSLPEAHEGSCVQGGPSWWACVREQSRQKQTREHGRCRMCLTERGVVFWKGEHHRWCARKLSSCNSRFTAQEVSLKRIHEPANTRSGAELRCGP